MISNRFKSLKQEYDVIIIGGGIYGATLLWELTSKGFTAVLVEKDDFGSATSANSLKIIHGGLRYLQTLDFRRIRESYKEQKYLLNAAPHLIQPLACIMPTFSHITNSRWAMELALKTYELVCLNPSGYKGKSLPAGKTFSNRQLHRLLPFLEHQDTSGGALWYDALNYNSERLTLKFILSACKLGADAFNYLEFRNFILHKDTAKGIRAYDKLSRQHIDVRAKCIVNAAGPWINSILQKIGPDKRGQHFQFAKAINIIIPRQLSDFAFALRDERPPVDDYAKPNRFFFFVPWREATMIGTWYFAHDGSPDEIALSQNEASRCIQQINYLLPDAKIREDEICFVHKGLVPIETDRTYQKLNLKNHFCLIDHDLQGGPRGVISVLGVKYTTARNVATKIADRILKKYDRIFSNHDVEISFIGDNSINDFQYFIQEKSRNNPFNLEEATVRHLALNFGNDYSSIENLLSENIEHGNRIPGSEEAIIAELLFCIKNERICHLSDLLIRRTDIGSLKKPKTVTIEFCAALLAKEMDWDETRKVEEIDALNDFYDGMVSRQ
jgi:glycerol-3-phosphate dehydrogenase